MTPGDRLREKNTGRLAFMLYECNLPTDSRIMVRVDGNDYNSLSEAGRWDTLPDEPFRPSPPAATPLVTVRYHIASWPYTGPVSRRQTELHSAPGRWIAPQDAFVDEITVE